MTYQNLLVDIAEDIGTVSINRPKALNALNIETLGELREVFEDLENNPEVRVVILTGAGDRAFVAGAEIQQMKDMNCLEATNFSHLGTGILHQIETSMKVVIAAVNGFALGGGMEIALACDFIYASENAKLGMPEVGLGIFPGWGGTQRLPRLIGKARAKELIFTGAMISAQEAKDLGIVNRVFPADSLTEEVHKVAKKIAANGPLAIALVKRVIERGYDVSLREGSLLETTTFGTLFTTEDQKEGMAAFAGKRKPEFKGQ